MLVKISELKFLFKRPLLIHRALYSHFWIFTFLQFLELSYFTLSLHREIFVSPYLTWWTFSWPSSGILVITSASLTLPPGIWRRWNGKGTHKIWPEPCLDPQMVLVVKNPPASAGDVRDIGSISRSERSLGVGNGKLLQYFGLENPMDREAW